jgi:hypothetical protein
LTHIGVVNVVDALAQVLVVGAKGEARVVQLAVLTISWLAFQLEPCVLQALHSE